MSQHISLNNLLGDEFTYNDLDPSIHTLECVDIITDILTCESNIIALEAVKKMQTGGTGPLPTNSKKVIEPSDHDSLQKDQTVIVDFESKINEQRNTIYESLRSLIRKIGEWIESVIFKIISFIRQDKLKLNNQSIVQELQIQIANGAKCKTYPFPEAPEDIVKKIISDIQAIISTLDINTIMNITQDSQLPIKGHTLLGITISKDNSDIQEKLEKCIFGGALASRTYLSAHISYTSLVYFITTAPEQLKQLRSLWYSVESRFPKYKKNESNLSYSKDVIINTQKAITLALSSISRMIFHISSTIKNVTK